MGCKVQPSEVPHLFGRASSDIHTDICRQALLALMSGTKFNTPFETKFFKWFLQGELNHELWFWLKLSASYE